MEKVCVFCGKRPQEKNKEHVIPQWLIRMTGDPKRIASFGIGFSGKGFAVRQFSFDAFTFPACKTCNQSFSEVEALAEPVVRSLISRSDLAASDFMVLLDWLDKVRVGLWLGYLYLDKNPLGVTPSFHIESRIGRLDRMVSILEVEGSPRGLSFSGTDSKFYQLSPTCFGLLINGVWLINASHVSLCSRRLGFPFAEPVCYREDQKLEVIFHPGSGRVMVPVERSAQLPKSVSLYQPVFWSLLDGNEEYLASDWVTDHTADLGRGHGKLFIQKDRAVEVYSEDRSTTWIPTAKWKPWEMIDQVPKYIYGRLRGDFIRTISLGATGRVRKHLRKQAAMLSRMDAALLRRIREQAIEMRKLDDSRPK